MSFGASYQHLMIPIAELVRQEIKKYDAKKEAQQKTSPVGEINYNNNYATDILAATPETLLERDDDKYLTGVTSIYPSGYVIEYSLLYSDYKETVGTVKLLDSIITSVTSGSGELIITVYLSLVYNEENELQGTSVDIV